MPDPVEITPTPLDVHRDWAYPSGVAEPGTPLVIARPDEEFQPGTMSDREDEAPVGLVVIAVAADGRLYWTTHVVGEDSRPSEVTAEHQEMIRQAYAPASALVEFRHQLGPDGRPEYRWKPGR